MCQRVILLSLPKADSIDIQFTNLTCEVKDSYFGSLKKILKGVSGTFKSGELSAIMGLSGAGKSTLLNILTGFERGKWTGEINYIGNQGKQSWKEYKKQSCYIQQDDHLQPLFTVWETMWMASNLKIGNSLSLKAKEMLIDEMLDNLDLSRTKETRCNRLSGGQKKRLSIALELLDNPPVMFLDEPTTGLDSLSSHQCIRLLRNLAKAGRTIICTIHQPSAATYEMFDTVYLLADGKCMYEGTTKNTVAYFSSIGLHCPMYHNPADYMIEIISKEYGDFNDQLAHLASNGEKSWRSNTSQIQSTEVNNSTNATKTSVLIQPPSEFEKFFVLIRRFTIQLFRDWTVTYLKIFTHFAVGVLLGLLYMDAGHDGSKTLSNVGFFMVSCTYLSYTSMMPAVFKFPLEMMTLKKERFNNWYQLRTYFVASFICNLPIQILYAFVYSGTSYFLSGQPLDVNRFLMYLMVAIMVTLMSDSVGVLIGILTNPINGTFLGAIILCAMLSLSGFLAHFSHMPRILFYSSYLSYIKYGVHAFVHAIYGFNREKLSCPKIYCHYNMPSTLLTDLSMTDGKYWFDIFLLFCGWLLCRIVVYLSLKRKLARAWKDV